MSDTAKQRLTTIDTTINPSERAQLVTPLASVDFLIESMMTGDNGLRYAALRAETPKSAESKSSGLLSRFWRWWIGSEQSDPIRLIYDAEAPTEDQDTEPGEPQEFEDFMLALVRGGTTFDASADGTIAAVDMSEQDEEDRIQLAVVHAGERLLLDVVNPTNEPITAKVTFAGPESCDE